jgi:hypothetical protein
VAGKSQAATTSAGLFRALEEQAKIHMRLRNQTLGKLRDTGWADGMQDAI